MSSTVKFDYSDIYSIHGEIKGLIETMRGDLETMNSNYQNVVQVPGEAIYGALGSQMLLNWDNVSSSFPKFMENFDSWAAYVASSYGNYDAVEKDIQGFRDANKYGYSQTLTQRGMLASAVAAGTASTNLYSESDFNRKKGQGDANVAQYEDYNAYLKANGAPTTDDILSEIKGDNTYADGSPIDDSAVAGYTMDKLPKYDNLDPVESATGAENGAHTRSVVSKYTESDVYTDTGADTPAADETPKEETPAADGTPKEETPAADGTPKEETTATGEETPKEETPKEETPAADGTPKEETPVTGEETPTETDVDSVKEVPDDTVENDSDPDTVSVDEVASVEEPVVPGAVML